eukprot:5004743-Alexandrium_andersonii.AAC.1
MGALQAASFARFGASHPRAWFGHGYAGRGDLPQFLQERREEESTEASLTLLHLGPIVGCSTAGGLYPGDKGCPEWSGDFGLEVGEAYRRNAPPERPVLDDAIDREAAVHFVMEMATDEDLRAPIPSGKHVLEQLQGHSKHHQACFALGANTHKLASKVPGLPWMLE